MEEGICPHSRSFNDDKGIEEERRLVYVGMTRARKSLTLTRAVYRRVFGNEQQLRASLPSRFLTEIPSELVETVRGSMAEIGATRRYEPDPEYSYSPEEFLRRVRGKPAPSAPLPRRSEHRHQSFGRSSHETRRERRSPSRAKSAASGIWCRHGRRRRGRGRRSQACGHVSRPRHEESSSSVTRSSPRCRLGAGGMPARRGKQRRSGRAS